MTESIRAIETWHNGRLYRSRTEARWAVFFEALAEPFLYEPEGFVLSPLEDSQQWSAHLDTHEDLFYIPDFWLPRAQQYIEIKPYSETWGFDDVTTEKARRLAYHASSQVVIVCGVPRWRDLYEQPRGDGYLAYIPSDDNYYWCECHGCQAVGLQYEGRTNRMACKRKGCPIYGNNEDRGHRINTERLRTAFTQASQNRS